MSSSMKSNNYKNSVKGLRKLTLGKTNKEIVVKNKKESFSFLEDIDFEPVEQYVETSNELTIQSCREKNGINFNDLPEDVVFLILGFLSYNTRLAILKNKYNKNYIKNKLKKIPKTIEGLNQMWECAQIAKYLLISLLEHNSGVFKNFSTYSLTSFKKEKNVEHYLENYKENFTKIILASIQHYSKIYKFGHYTNKKVIEQFEKTILNIFVRISIMK